MMSCNRRGLRVKLLRKDLIERVPLPEAERQIIRCAGGELPRMVDQAEAALMSPAAHLYVRGSLLVTPVSAAVVASDGREFQAPRLHPVTDTWLVERLTSLATFERLDRRSKAYVILDCPATIARSLMARQQWRLPKLAGIITAPSLRGNGTIIAADGYDHAAKLLVVLGETRFRPIKCAPTHADARRALEDIHELFATFPFVADVDLAVATSAVLTSLVRRMLPTAPIHAVTAHTAGSGKSLLVDLVAIVATGRRAPVTAAGRAPEEMDKRLGAMLLQGHALISFDNLHAPLSGDLLAQTVTQEAVMLRLLGHSITVETPTNAMLFATGNNLRIMGDLTRRCLVARLDPACEHPELRTFDRDVLAYAAARRADIVWAALTIMKAYLVAGRPGTLPLLGSFETWSSLVREAIVWAGGQDPVQSMEAGRASDPQRERLLAIMAAWWDAFRDREVTASEVIAKTGADTGLRDALDAIKPDNQELTAKRLGEWLAKISGQRIRDARFETTGKRHGSAVWRLMGYEGVGA